MVSKKHIINKVFFEVNAPDTKTAYYLKDNLDMFLKQSLLPTIQSYFDGLSSDDHQIVRFEKLELNINSKDVKDQLQLQLDIIKSLQKQITQTKSESTFEKQEKRFLTTTREKSEVETFLYFLKTGQNPWWNSEKNMEDTFFLDTIISDKNFEVQIRECLVNPNSRQRLVYQFSDQVLIRIFTKGKSNPRFPKILQKNKVREQYWNILTNYLAHKNIKPLQEGLTKIFIELTQGPNIEKNIYQVVTKEIIQILEDSSKSKSFQKENQSEQLLKLKKVLIKIVMQIVSNQLGAIQKVSDAINISEAFINKTLHKELKEQFDVKVFDKNITTSVEKAVQVANDILNGFKKEIFNFTSELIPEKLEFIAYDIVKVSDQTETINQYREFDKEEKTEVEPSIYIQNAGLVLLHPYLGRFLENLKMLNDHGKIKPEKVEIVIHVLHYLATKIENQSESNLVFEKFLCGYPLDKPIRKNVSLSKKMKQEAEELLKAIIKNWAALKNTSPDGLRENFIKRSGKIILDDPAKYKVLVERKTQDILLEKLPWNLTIIKLPWIDKMVFVEW